MTHMRHHRVGMLATILRRLAHPPRERHRRWRHAGEALAPGHLHHEPAERYVGHMVEGRLVEAARDLFLLVETLCGVPGLDLGFDGGARRPSVQRQFTLGAEQLVGWTMFDGVVG